MSIGKQLKALREVRGMTQAQLAELVGTDFTNISRIENDRVNPSMAMLRRLLDAMEGRLNIEAQTKDT